MSSHEQPSFMQTTWRKLRCLFLYFMFALICFVIMPFACFFAIPFTGRFRTTRNQFIGVHLFDFLRWSIQWPMKVSGRHNIPSMEAQPTCLFIMNHQSMFDVLIMTEVIKPRVAVALVKREIVWQVPLFGLASYVCGNILINRKKGSTNKEKLHNDVKQLAATNNSVFVCPEGTRYIGKDILPFKKGAFHLAVSTGIPIVPVVVSSFDYLYNLSKCEVVDNARIFVQVLPPIDTKDLTTEDIDELVESTHSLMNKKYHEINSNMSTT